MKLLHLSKNEKSILNYLYKFRFINTNQFQDLFGYKYPRTVQLWLKKLKSKGYVTYRNFDRNNFYYNRSPAIYSLTKLARLKLKTDPKYEIRQLNRIYQEAKLSQSYVDRYIFIINIFLNLLSQVNEGQKLHFSTKVNLSGFDYFPDPLPDAYIALKSPGKAARYFLIYFDERIPLRKLKERIEGYLEYVEANDWGLYSKDPLPSFLLILPKTYMKKKAVNLINQSFTDGKFFVSTRQDIINANFSSQAWEKIE